tara:strand:+ start:256 stop:1143 length:888 start_codon:yes stop_codon:yes gene_type:complete
MKECVYCNKEFNEPYVKCSPCRETHRLVALKYRNENKDKINARTRQRNTERYGIRSCQTCEVDLPYNGNNRSYSRLKYCSHECRPCSDEEHLKEGRVKRARAKGIKPMRTFANEEERKKHKRQQANAYYHNMTQEQRDRRNTIRRKWRKQPEVRAKERQDLRDWWSKNPIKRKEHYLRWINHPTNRLRNKLQGSLRNALLHKGNKPTLRSIFKLFTFTKKEFKEHIESFFTEENNYSWDNINEWHIDHIQPFASFNFNQLADPTSEDFKKCWALENLQPLWALDNLKKGAKEMEV